MLKSANIRLEDFNHLPCHVFLKNKEGIYLYSNDYVFELGLNIKSSDFLGLLSSHYQSTDQRIYASQIPEKIDERIEYKIGSCYKSKTYKQPLCGSSNKIIGVLGFCYYSAINENNDIKKLSGREIMCAKQMAQGKTAKEIAKYLNISHKTVEFHIANIKSKLNCYRKSEIIEKVFPRENILFSTL